jgi:hypothetical protein
MILIALMALAAAAQDWQPLNNWKQTAFPRQGTAHISTDEITLDPGAPMTGVTASEFKPTINYEIRFEASRLKGNDFFASLTFPFNGSHATWVNGGWGGDIIGISSIDNWDASENETRAYFNFENDRFYRFRIEIKPTSIRAWIDDKLVVNLSVNNRTISLRRGMDITTPLSLFSYNSAASIRKIEYRLLTTR